MRKTRQDAWTKDEDRKLQEIVLRQMEAGQTQVSAFAIAGKELNRTPAACGFRWNAFLRKQVKEEVKQAKQHRQLSAQTANEDTIHHIIKQLQALQKTNTVAIADREETSVEQLKAENTQLKKEIERYEAAWKEMHHLWNWIKDHPSFVSTE